jgi:hypothetical protein
MAVEHSTFVAWQRVLDVVVRLSGHLNLLSGGLVGLTETASATPLLTACFPLSGTNVVDG